MIFDTIRRSFRTPSRPGEVGVGRVELGEVLTRSETVLRPLITEKAIRFSVWWETTDEGIAVWADAEKLTQIVVCLVGDAVRASAQRGRISLTVQTAGEMAEIQISDSGLGVEPEDLEAISGRPLGARLPMDSARTWARRMNGDLLVMRRPGRGSTFRLTLPAARADAPRRLRVLELR